MIGSTRAPFFEAFAVFVAAASSSCSSAPPPSPLTGITVSTGDLIPAFSPDVFGYEVTSLTTLVPVDVTVTGQDVTIDGTPVKSGVPYETTLPSLDDSTSIRIQATDRTGAPTTYTIHSVPAQRPLYKVTTASSPVPGQILLTPIQLVGGTGGPSFLYVLDETGRLLFYKKEDQAPSDFERVTLPDGTIRYTYILEDGPMDPTVWPLMPSTGIVLDDHFRQVKTVRLAAAGSHAAFGIDVHEFKLIDDDHWIVQSYLGETVSNVPGYASSGVASGVVQEVQGGQILFDFETTSVPSLYTDSTEGDDFTNAKGQYADYAHLNAMDIDPSNGNLVISLRDDDEIIEVDHTSGAVVWTLGGQSDDFGLAAADKSSHQHYVRFLGPNHLMMFDNGNASQLTKIREYQIDPVAHTAQPLAAISVDNHFSVAMGSVQKIAGHYFIGWGFRQATESDITEIDATTQAKTFELSFQGGYVSYRALKFQ